MAEKSQTEVHWSKDGQVATIRFATPGGVNIFSSRVVEALGKVVEEVRRDGDVRFVVLRGDGKVFLAGADISEMSQFAEADGKAFGERGHRVFDAIEQLPQVTIAAMNGHAMGGGCEVSLACDFRLMVNGAKIGQPETRLGLIPGWGGTQRLPKVVPLGVARRLLFSGDTISAEEAQRIGLVDEVVPSVEELDGAIAKWCQMLTPGSPAAIGHVKQALLTGDEVGEFARCFNDNDAQEGTTAFLEKRKASWMG